MTACQPPSEAAVRVFIDNMIAFRMSLVMDRQRMLDTLVDAGPRTRADIGVRPFWGATESGMDFRAAYRAAAVRADSRDITA
jgi:hypothetical protein